MARKAATDTIESAQSKLARFAWKRDPADQTLSERLGQRIRGLREQQRLSLSDASNLTGIPAATLSRIETNKMSPTFPTLIKLMTGLRVSWSELVVDVANADAAEVSIAMPSEGEPTEVPGYAYFAPHLASRMSARMQPLIFDVRATSVEAAGGLRGHRGHEFCYVLSGTVIMHIEGRDPVELTAGASILFNCEIPHAYVAKARSRPRVLNVTVSDTVAGKEALPFSARYAEIQKMDR